MIGSALHRAALAMAAADIPVFPCVPNGKRPATENGFKDATTDTAQIDGWWGQAEYNLALCPEDAGWFVVDLDIKDPARNGIEGWKQLQEEHGHVTTYTNETASGGRHLVFTGSGASSTSRLRGGVDTRGVGGYVLWPPSVVGGCPYRLLHAGDLTALPPWITTALAPTIAARQVDTDVPLDLPFNITRALADIKADIREHGEPIIGNASDARAYELAAKLRDKGLSDNRIADVLEEHWAPHFDRTWLETKVTSADDYAQNARGVDAVLPASNIVEFAKYAASLPIETPKRSRFYPEDPSEQDQHPDPTWLLPGLLPDAAIALVFGGSGSFKTFLVLDMALSIANNVESAFGVAPSEAGAVFYGALEGRHEIKQRRKSWELAHGIVGSDYPFYVLPAPYISSDEQCQEFIEQIAKRLAGRRCKMVVIDTVFKAMTGLKLTSDEHGSLFVAFCQTLRDKFDCAVVAIHHPSKGDAGSAFGSYTLVAGFDSVARVERIPKTLHTTFTVEQHRDAAEPQQPYRFKGRVLGPSLVFQKAEPQAAALAAQVNDQFSRTSVGAAIRRLNAGDIETSVTTHVLASELTPIETGEPVERHRERIAEASRKLGALASKTLAAYCERGQRGLVWYVPKAT